SWSGGQHNVLLGHYSGSFLTTGSNNVIIGHYAGSNMVTGSGNVFIGYKAGFNETGSNYLYISNSQTSSPLVWGDFSNQIFKINGSIEYTGSLTYISDLRLKKNITAINDVIEKLKSLRGVYYEWDKNETSGMVVDDGRQIGVIAQDVEKAFPELVVTNNKGYKMVDYIKLTPILLEGIKEQQGYIEGQQKQIDSQRLENQQLRSDLQALKERLDRIEGMQAEK
ncbi:MAG: tail fiber domain-containing protein, partial [Bacteroidales bacterium]